MCKCNPTIRTPYCGRGDCVWPHQKVRLTPNQRKARERIDFYESRILPLLSGVKRDHLLTQSERDQIAHLFRKGLFDLKKMLEEKS